jgi:hypothetical protein
MTDINSSPIPIRRTLTTVSNGIPSDFTKETTSQNQKIISKGVLNKLLLRPQIVNEHQEAGDTLQDTVDSSTIVGQIFRASKSNLNGLSLKLASGNVEVFDDFNSYADNAALRAAWVNSDPPDNDPVLKTATPDPYEGAKYMDISYNWESDPGPTLTRTITAKNCTGGAFRFAIYPRITWGEGSFRFFVGDGTNTKYLDIVTTVVNQWQQVIIPVDGMVEGDPDNPVDTANITKVGFQVNDWTPSSTGKYAGIDYIEFIAGAGNLDIKLWDMGSSIPVAGVTKINDGTQYTTLGDPDVMTPVAQITLSVITGGEKRYQLDDFVAGLAGSTLLTVGNYYAITLHYNDTDIEVYGSDGSEDKYSSGFSFTAPDVSTAITAVGANKDIMFQAYSAQEAYVVSSKVFFKTNVGAIAVNGINSSYEILVEKADGTLEGMITSEIQAGVIEPSSWLRPVNVEVSGKIQMYFNDDSTDNAYKMYLIAEYAYEPPTIYG